MTALLILAGLALVAVLARRGEPERGASVDELAAARAIAAARLRRYAEEREERMRHYHAEWSRCRPVAGVRRYVLPFAAGGQR